jgi:uncharacterized protein involved in outer membrane biogenesis
VLASLGSLVLAAATVVWLFDWNWLRHPVIGFASAHTGRALRIGNLEGEWAWRPRVRIDNVHFGNAEWASGPDVLAAEQVEFVIDLPSLLKGTLVLPQVRLVKPVFDLERRADGQTNWTLAARLATDAVVPDERSDLPLIGRLAIEEGTLKYRDPIAGLDIEGKIQAAEGSGGEGTGEARFEGKGTLQGEPFAIQLVGGSLLSLTQSKIPYTLAADMTVGQTKGRLEGTLVDPFRFEGLDLEIRLQGPNLAKLTKLTGVPLPLTPPYDLKARLERQGALWTLEQMTGRMGRSDLAGRIKIDGSRPRLFIDADLRSKRLDYRDIGSLLGVKPIPSSPPAPAPARDKSAAPAKPTPPVRVLPDAPLMVEQVRAVDARVRFRGDKVAAPNTPLEAMDMMLELREGVMKFAPLAVGVAGGRAVANVEIDARTDRIRTDYDIKLSTFRLERFLAEAGYAGAGQGRIDGRIKLVGFGDSVRKSLATADGEIRLVMNSGTMSNLALELLGLDIAESLGFLIGGDKNVTIRCLIGSMKVTKGELVPRAFVLDTTDTTVTAEGAISLRDESMNLRVKAHPKDISILAARSPIHVGGHLGRPDVNIEVAPLAARGAGAVLLGALLSPLASVLAFVDPGLEQDSDCAKLLQENRVR